MPKSSKPSRPKPEKPYPEFPLFAHAAGYWAKKINGKLHYFGRWDDWRAALEKYNENRERLHAGQALKSDQPTVRDLLNAFMNDRLVAQDTGQITRRTFGEYKRCCDRMSRILGLSRPLSTLGSADWAALKKDIGQRWGLQAQANEIGRIRSVLIFAYESGLIDAPLRFGTLKRPSKKLLRRHRAKQPKRMFAPEQIHKLHDAANDQFKAIILLGCNGGFTGKDVAELTAAHIDFRAGWLEMPRSKTGVNRRAKLWPQTIQAIERWRSASNGSPLLFYTRFGQPWVHPETLNNTLSAEFRKLLKRCDLYQKGRGFHALRHVFETVGGETGDQIAVDLIMGHERDDMATVYREAVSDQRLEAVANHVHAWLFGQGGGA